MNVKPGKYENCSKFMDLVECFNITTNVWCKNYVFKRCRVLGFKTLSQVITMVFLAVWHGLCSGYFLCFFFELFPITFEKQILHLCHTNAFIKKNRERYLWIQDVFKFFGKMYFLFFLPHCLTPFVLLKYDVYFPVLWSTRFLVVTVFGLWFVIMGLFERFLKTGGITMTDSRDDVSGKKVNWYYHSVLIIRNLYFLSSNIAKMVQSQISHKYVLVLLRKCDTNNVRFKCIVIFAWFGKWLSNKIK